MKYQLARHPISDVKVTVSNVVDRFALATVSYRQDGKAVQQTLNLTQQENSARFLGLFPSGPSPPAPWASSRSAARTRPTGARSRSWVRA